MNCPIAENSSQANGRKSNNDLCWKTENLEPFLKRWSGHIYVHKYGFYEDFYLKTASFCLFKYILVFSACCHAMNMQNSVWNAFYGVVGKNNQFNFPFLKFCEKEYWINVNYIHLFLHKNNVNNSIAVYFYSNRIRNNICLNVNPITTTIKCGTKYNCYFPVYSRIHNFFCNNLTKYS